MKSCLNKLLGSSVSGIQEHSHSAVLPELEQIDTYSMCGIKVLEKLYVLARDVVNRNVLGDFVECGVCNGGSAAAIACALRGTGRRTWLYDSFQGLPIPREVDGPLAATKVDTKRRSTAIVR